MKKFLTFWFLLLCAVSLSFAQIYKGEVETRNGKSGFSLHYVEYAEYRFLLYIDGVSIFIEEDQLTRLEAILEKFAEWEALAAAEHINLTKTIDSITFSSFHFNHTFFKEPLVFYFVFTGETPSARYSLFIDTSLERITPFRLSSNTVREMQDALTQEKLSEAWDAYENQKALEEMFR